VGYDHQEDSSAEKMESIEIEALKKIGIANPY
jgi:ssRNA-specific RNase YbeY (16S rRNA maturation enzyme)